MSWQSFCTVTTSIIFKGTPLFLVFSVLLGFGWQANELDTLVRDHFFGGIRYILQF